MRRLPRFATPAQLESYRKERSDYLRVRNRPTKVCAKCHREFPNTDKFFARGASGWIQHTCLDCSERMHSHAYLARAGGVSKAPCPICRERGLKLVQDRQASQVVWMCRRCLSSANWFTSQEVFERAIVYARWRNNWPAEPVAAPQPDTPQVAGLAKREPYMEEWTEEEDDERVDDPVGEPDSYPQETQE